MSDLSSKPTTRLARTPALEALLGRVASRLRTRVWMHGLGTIALVLSAWILFAFLADWGLRVPRVVRLLHGAVLLGLGGFFLWRSLLLPLRRIPDRTGLAILIEKRRPDLKELLVSAVQFQDARTDAGDPELIERVLRQAEEEAGNISLQGVLEDREPRQRFGGGLLLGAVTLVLALVNPGLCSIFFNRLVGGNALWPQRTRLALDIPDLGAGTRMERDGEVVRVWVARGTDVPVIVNARGLSPDEVRLAFDGGQDMVLGAVKEGVFRTLLSSCQEDLAFSVSGGDDRDGLPRAEIFVLQPPDVEGLAIRVEPPSYSGREAHTVFDQDVEVLAGSKVTVYVRPFPDDAQGQARLLPDDERIALTSAPFPAEASGGDAPSGLSFELFADKSIGFRIDLTDSSGLSNPDPGLFRIRVVEDRPPEVQVLAPKRTEFEIVKGGALPLRARAEDDFGLTEVRWAVRPSTLGESEAASVLEGVFELQDIPNDAKESARAALAGIRLEVDDLGEEVSVDQWYSFEIVATDNREPVAGEGRALPLRARVVTADELLRRMQSRLAQTRLAALRLSDLQREKANRVEELLESLEGDSALQSGDAMALAAALNGQRRVRGDSQALARELADVVEDVLYARLDEKAGALLEFYDTRSSELGALRFDATPFRELAQAKRDGKLGPSGFAGNLVDLVDLTLEISEDHAQRAVEALARAQDALKAADIQDALLESADLQDQCLKRIEALLERLAEWDNFQNVLALTRDILNGQKTLRERTQQFASEEK